MLFIFWWRILDVVLAERLLFSKGLIFQFYMIFILCFQLTPFPFDLVKQEIQRFPNARLCWAQEEHKNAGAWSYVEPRLRTVCRKMGTPKKIE